MVKSVSIAVVLLLASGHAFASGGGDYIHEAGHDPGNVKSLQRGARSFVNYCVGCHSAKYVRYSRIAQDLAIPETVLRENLMFGQGKVGSTIASAMPDDEAMAWFNAVPPDLSLVARSRGADWIFSYLTSFYRDDSALFGVNNLVLEGASMPHVLVELQGMREAVFATESHGDGDAHGDSAEEAVEAFKEFKQISEGSLSEVEYAAFARDLTNFLDYIGEPIRLERERLGYKVLAFLALMFVLAYALKQEFWKDVH